jgi:hypothetical protein
MYHKFRHFRSKKAIAADKKRAQTERILMRQRKRKRTDQGDIIPTAGDRVEVLFDQRFWYGGTVNKKKKDLQSKDENAVLLHIIYDDLEKEWAKFPDPGNIKLSDNPLGADQDNLTATNGAAGSDQFEPVGWMSMSIQDYDSYLRVRAFWMDARTAEIKKQNKKQRLAPAPTAEMSVADSLEAAGVQRYVNVADCKNTILRIDVAEDVLYLIDLPIPTLLPELQADLNRNFLLPEALPAGTHCLQQYVAVTGRPFMGPNLYVAPPGAVTWFHEDGHGTVDSGHQCLLGENEVVMLRRMPEEHKQRAIRLLANDREYSLRDKPHDIGDKPPWPTKKQIKKLRKMGYAPSCFVLGPGEFVHINKGRLHAFQKKILELEQPDQICVSFAWDWMFQGVTAEGFEAEAKTSLMSAHFNHKSKVASLGITETALLQAAKVAAADMVSIQRQLEMVSEVHDHTAAKDDHTVAKVRPLKKRALCAAEGAPEPIPTCLSTMATLSTLLTPRDLSVDRSTAAANLGEDMVPAVAVMAGAGGGEPLTPLHHTTPASSVDDTPHLSAAAAVAQIRPVLHGVGPCVQQIFERLGKSVSAVAEAMAAPLQASSLTAAPDTNVDTNVDTNEAAPVVFRVGSKVEARWEDHEWYPAVVSAVIIKRGSVPRAYTIRYEEDGVEGTQQASTVRTVRKRARASESSSKPAVSDVNNGNDVNISGGDTGEGAAGEGAAGEGAIGEGATISEVRMGDPPSIAVHTEPAHTEPVHTEHTASCSAADEKSVEANSNVTGCINGTISTSINGSINESINGSINGAGPSKRARRERGGTQAVPQAAAQGAAATDKRTNGTKEASKAKKGRTKRNAAADTGMSDEAKALRAANP